jgi:hypothetical protein
MDRRYVALDRLERHTEQAFERIEEKLDHHLAVGGKAANKHIIKLRARHAKLQKTYAFEKAKIERHIKNRMAGPHAERPRARSRS